MTTETFHLSEDYLLHVTVSDVVATSAKHLLIESQWLGAKHPHERQRKFDVTLSPTQLKVLGKVITEAA